MNDFKQQMTLLVKIAEQLVVFGNEGHVFT